VNKSGNLFLELTNAPLITVVICTYNRANLLTDALQTLCTQKLSTKYYEIIVVDNNSKDNTRAVAGQFCTRYPNVYYYMETQQGLSHARNRGWQVAKGQYVAYIDDDCKVPEQWLAVAKDIIERISPTVFGGPSYNFYNKPKPRWYKDSYGSNEPYKQPRILREKECVNIYGSNMVFRRAVLRTMGGFDPGLGMSGKKIAYGEETALLQLISTTMPSETIYYDPRLYVHHLVQEKRMSLFWTARQRFVQGIYIERLFHTASSVKFNLFQLLKREARLLFVFANDLILGTLKRDRTKYFHFENYLYEDVFNHLTKMGKQYGRYKYDRHHS
jgi:glycosyltransferase involved in cell wall biosynthesis